MNIFLETHLGSCINLSMAHAVDQFFPGKFFMLGIIHRDRRNDRLLEEWIGKLKPEVITLELSPYGLAFRRSLGGVYRRKIDDICDGLRLEGHTCVSSELEDLYSYVEIPREYEIAGDYCRRTNACLYPVDMDLFSFMKLREIDELISRENIRKNLSEKERSGGSTEEVLAGLYFRSGVTAFSYSEEMVLRDRFMCHGIGLLMKRLCDKRFLHIAGWQHLKDPLNLYAQFQPVKIFPYD